MGRHYDYTSSGYLCLIFSRGTLQLYWGSVASSYRNRTELSAVCIGQGTCLSARELQHIFYRHGDRHARAPTRKARPPPVRRHVTGAWAARMREPLRQAGGGGSHASLARRRCMTAGCASSPSAPGQSLPPRPAGLQRSAPQPQRGHGRVGTPLAGRRKLLVSRERRPQGAGWTPGVLA